jgi:metallophosphoesterase (TIGR00282 family)
MRILFLGDIVGRPGLELVKSALPGVRARLKLDCVIANAENASGGSGCLPAAYRQLRAAGVDLVTLGDHVYKKAEIIETLRNDDALCRPANLPAAAPGHTAARAVLADGTAIVAVCVLGRTFMRSADCPFTAVDRVLGNLRGPAVVVVDVHAEATADKYLLLHHLKGRVAAVLGTHTHVPTADEAIYPPGTAFQCDVGMCGPHESILGRRIDRVLSHTLTAIPTPFEVAEGDVRLNGATIDIDATGRAIAIERFTVRADEVGRA